MSYQVLARKWRPTVFTEVVGQQHVIRGLSHALDQQALHHAYLFSGTRGVGKTTLARILAKSVNCEKGISSQPCGQCSACQQIAEGRFPDLIEIDAASRTRVEDTRDLLDNVQYAPTCGRYKIYLIDEVHMLSTHSFNALLKTLEEPPEHVKFLLATTDPQKLPITVLSRCLQFNLKALPIEQIQQQLVKILSQENIDSDPEALLMIAQAADGSMRDALSLLDQAIANGQGRVDHQATCDMLGSIQQNYFIRISQALSDSNHAGLIEVSSELAEMHCDYQRVLSDLARWFFELAMIQQLPDWSDSTFSIADLQSHQAYFDPEIVQLYYEIIVKGAQQLSFAPSPKVGFEMLLLRLLAFTPAIEAGVMQTPAIHQHQSVAKHKSVPKVASETLAKPIAAPQKPTAPDDIDSTDKSAFWHQVCDNLSVAGIAKQVALNCRLLDYQDNTMRLSVDHNHQAVINERLIKQIETALSQYLSKKIQLTIETDGTDQASQQQTPRQQKQQQQQDRQQQAEAEIQQDQHVRFMKTEFNAIIRDVKPTEH